ncbi:MAG: transketolase [Planctomycetes bacterium]|nr:transketolase [Planctomycetota bacterium]
MAHETKSPHTAASLSLIELLVATYWGVLDIDPQRPAAPERDRFILSQPHAAAAHYAVLAERGFFSVALLDRYGKRDRSLPEPMTPGCAAGVEAVPGSPGAGLSIGAGMALAARIRKQPYRVFVLLGDSECDSGSVWEAADFAAAQRLGNLTVMIDDNGAKGAGDLERVSAPLAEKWRAFGWDVKRRDGHDMASLIQSLDRGRKQLDGRPRCLLARTVSGKGVSFMENNDAWRRRVLNHRDLAAALAELRSML